MSQVSLSPFVLLDIAFPSIPQNPYGGHNTFIHYFSHIACNERQVIFQVENKLLLNRMNESKVASGGATKIVHSISVGSQEKGDQNVRHWIFRVLLRG